MEAFEAILGRRSVRAFKPDPVPAGILNEILEAARWTPSAQNIQPWQFLVIGGEVMARLKTQFAANLNAKVERNLDLPAPEYPELYMRRATENRNRIDQYQFPPGTHDLQKKRDEYYIRGGTFHEAPNAVIICMERELLPHCLFEAGSVAQTICLAAHARGLGTCIMRRSIWWPDVIRDILKVPPNRLMVIAIAIGYPDTNNRVNGYPRHREPLRDMVRYYDV